LIAIKSELAFAIFKERSVDRRPRENCQEKFSRNSTIEFFKGKFWTKMFFFR